MRIARYLAPEFVETQEAARAVLDGRYEATAVVERGRLRAIVFHCPCGCRDKVVINLDPDVGAAWRLRVENDRVTLMPSVWRDSKCASHFILWKGRVFWCHDDGEIGLPDEVDEELRAARADVDLLPRRGRRLRGRGGRK